MQKTEVSRRLDIRNHKFIKCTYKLLIKKSNYLYIEILQSQCLILNGRFYLLYKAIEPTISIKVA